MFLRQLILLLCFVLIFNQIDAGCSKQYGCGRSGRCWGSCGLSYSNWCHLKNGFCQSNSDCAGVRCEDCAGNCNPHGDKWA